MNSVIKSKKVANHIAKAIIFSFGSLSVLALISMFGFIIYKAFPALQNGGFKNILLSSNLNNYGIWSSLLISIIVAFGAVFLALPIAIRIAVVIRFRLKKTSKIVRSIIEVMSGVPSIIFGVFTLNSLGPLTSTILRIHTNLNIISAIIMLAIMSIPTMVSLIVNQLFTLPNHLIDASIALGNSKTYSIYKVGLKYIKSGIWIAVLVSFGRVIGETMATAMILNRLAPKNIFLSNFFGESFMTLATTIAALMFTDSSDPRTVQVAFAMGLSLFVVVMFLVLAVYKISSNKTYNKFDLIMYHQNKLNKLKIYRAKFTKTIAFSVFTLNLLLSIFSYLFLLIVYAIKVFFVTIKQRVNNWFKIKPSTIKSLSMRVDIYREAMEWIQLLLVFLFIGWLLYDVVFWGSKAFNINDLYVYKNGVANSLVWTLLLILATLIIAFPISLFGALFLSEYAKNKWYGRLIQFFLDCLGSTPSIIFGMFGLVVFLNTFNLYGAGKTSLIAGALTMVLVIIPSYTRSIEQVLSKFPDELRNASMALGASKFETIRKIVLPAALNGIITGTIIAISRIISETAPVFLTLGMNFNPNFGLTQYGQTLTTSILANQLFGTESYNNKIAISYKFAFITISIIIILTISIYLIDPIVKIVKKAHKKSMQRRYNYE
ncbi:ABC transporter permease subunit [Mycoplasmopsis mucosicanis]|uniref:ABC transporter permease subunit n=1 Tax=Mycoplasmopsis mucosicanis TaxID=458208 RepID=A0A507SXQ7_9BACT|nr:ABC transporter permease subunit [Mycoplasmopsis mucosicanis]TQC54023.1 ABC transporter permease subunit [Mycoplasmopsis mucosicanis]